MRAVFFIRVYYPLLARRVEKHEMDFSIFVEYNFIDYYEDHPGQTLVISCFSKHEYVI